MAKQKIRKHQYKVRKSTTDYAVPFFKFGSVGINPGGSGDFTVNTGVAKFPNGVIAGGVNPSWPNASWAQDTRGITVPGQGATNIEFSVHYEGPGQNVQYRWWALGY